jgi:GNAT superfamily N-acetyltransferase
MEKPTLKNVTAEETLKHFFKIATEVECGSHFDFSNPKHEAWLRRKYDRYEYAGNKFFAAFQKDGTPVGYGILVVEEGLDGIKQVFAQKTELISLGVSSEYQGMGYGKKLVEYAERLSRETGAYCMYISTYAKDHGVIDFYGKCGYAPVATLPDVHGPGDEGLVYMRKIIRK